MIGLGLMPLCQITPLATPQVQHRDLSPEPLSPPDLVQVLVDQHRLCPVVETPHVIDATLLSALSTLFRQVVIVSGHYCSHTSLVVLLMAMVTTNTLVMALSGHAPCLVVIIPSAGTPDTSLLPHLGHISMAGGDVL